MRSDPRELREHIRAAGRQLGFDQVGFAPALEPPNADAYLRWLDRGWHGEMAYMARPDAIRRRLDPGEAIPGCRSIIVVSLAYGAPGPTGSGADAGGSEQNGATGTAPGGPTSTDSRRPVVARYASGRDYHAVFEEGLSRLGERVTELAPTAAHRGYVDYGPVLERDHAQRAGLGWIGKNTMLINPRLGSWLLLGELLTTLDLPPDPPFVADRCGTCRRCIDACPTGAIREGARGVDSRLCISYLTIELRGPIPVELRPLIGNRVFGCDICQEVCPWNSHAAPKPTSAGGSRAPATQPPTVRSETAGPGETEPGIGPETTESGSGRDGLESQDRVARDQSVARMPLAFGDRSTPATMIEWAAELLALSDEAFRRRYGETALARPRREGLLRNLCVGLGNSGDPAAGPILQRCLGDASELVREHARWALARLAAGEKA